jgi:hypothetical protein
VKPFLFVAFAFTALTVAPAAQAADPSVGECLSATETSLHLRSSLRLRESRAQLLICSAATCPSEVREECMHRIGDLNASEPTVVFAVKTRAGQELSDVRVTMDGEAVADHLDGSALSLDPGSHQFTFEAPGMLPVTKTILLHEGEKGREESVVVEPPAPSIGPPSRERGRHVLGIAVGAAGLAGLAAGGIFGALARSSWNTAKGECPTYMTTGCSGPAIHEQNVAATFATASTAGFIAGGVLLAGGITVYLTAPKDKSRSVGVEVTVPAGLVVTGTF